MRLLLDTHTFLWFIGGEAALSPYARQLIEDRTNKRLLSIASLWEMAIKVSLRRLTVPLPFTDPVAEHVYGNAIELFGMLPRHSVDLKTRLPRPCGVGRTRPQYYIPGRPSQGLQPAPYNVRSCPAPAFRRG